MQVADEGIQADDLSGKRATGEVVLPYAKDDVRQVIFDFVDELAFEHVNDVARSNHPDHDASILGVLRNSILKSVAP